ncbi:MAG: cupin [Solirubrobacterales bacterium]|nr:cupin [Solirubrobacterales bacterium]
MARKLRRPMKVRWSDLEMEDVRPGVRRCGFGGRDALLVMNELQPGMEVRPHSHERDQIALVLAGRMRFVIEDEEHELGPGEALLIPGGAVHAGEAVGDGPALNLDVFAPPRADYAHLTAWMAADDD